MNESTNFADVIKWQNKLICFSTECNPIFYNLKTFVLHFLYSRKWNDICQKAITWLCTFVHRLDTHHFSSICMVSSCIQFYFLVRLNTYSYNTYIRKSLKSLMKYNILTLLWILNTFFFHYTKMAYRIRQMVYACCLRAHSYFTIWARGFPHKNFGIDKHKYGLISDLYLMNTSILHVSITWYCDDVIYKHMRSVYVAHSSAINGNSVNQ